MKQRSGLVTMRGNPVTLVGEEVKVGEPAPDLCGYRNGYEARAVLVIPREGMRHLFSSVPRYAGL